MCSMMASVKHGNSRIALFRASFINNPSSLVLFVDHNRVKRREPSAKQVLAVGMSRSTSKASRGPCVISAEQALSIFLLARQHHRARHLAARLAPQVGISGKAIRDIWSLRTWTHVTRAHWTPADLDRYTKKQQHKLKQHAEFSQHVASEEGLSSGSAGTSGSVTGDISVEHSSGDADSENLQSEPVQGLPTLPSWRLLSSSALATMEDAMAFLDAESEKEGRSRAASLPKLKGEAQTAAFKQCAFVLGQREAALHIHDAESRSRADFLPRLMAAAQTAAGRQI